MFRRVLAILASVSLLLCLGVCAAWVRSAYVTDERVIEAPDETIHVTSGQGALVLYRVDRQAGESRWMRPTERWNVLGVMYIEGRLNRRRPWGMLIVPYWLPAGLAAVLPGCWLAMRARDAGRRRHAALRECVRCGADLEDDATSCPRCSRPVDGRKTPAPKRAEGYLAASLARRVSALERPAPDKSGG
jgi:hypothetical protein